MIDQRLADHPVSKLAMRLLIELGEMPYEGVTPILQLTQAYLGKSKPVLREGNWLVELEDMIGNLTPLPEMEQAALFVADWEGMQKELESGKEWQTLEAHLNGVLFMLNELTENGAINPMDAGALLADNLFCCLRHAYGFGPL